MGSLSTHSRGEEGCNFFFLNHHFSEVGTLKRKRREMSTLSIGKCVWKEKKKGY
jgi:hypothetical protein